MELQPKAYTTATAMQHLRRIYNLHHSSRQCRILNPLSKAGDRTLKLVVPSRIRQPLRHDGNSEKNSFFFFVFCLFFVVVVVVVVAISWAAPAAYGGSQTRG